MLYNCFNTLKTKGKNMANKIIKCIKIILPIVIILIMVYGIGGQIYLSDERTEDMSFCESLDTKWYRV